MAQSGDSDVRVFKGTSRLETRAGERIELVANEALKVDVSGKADRTDRIEDTVDYAALAAILLVAFISLGVVPGPEIRVTEGDTVNFTLDNPKTNFFGHSMDFHAAEIDFLKNYREIKPGQTIQYTFVAKKPGVFFYHCGAAPMIQHIARGMFGAIIVDPKDAKAWPKADREYVLVQSEFWKNPDDVQAMFDRKFDNTIFNGGIWKYHPFFIGAAPLEAKPNEMRARLSDLVRKGDFLLQIDQKQRALEHYKRYLSLAPNAPDSDNLRKWIQEAEEPR